MARFRRLRLAGSLLPAILSLMIAGCMRSGDPAPVVSGISGGSAGSVIVERGDSPASIAKRYEVPLADLLAANGLNARSTIVPGQRLSLPGTKVYVVRRGDTLNGVARMLGVDPMELARTNGLQPPYTVQLGQSLRLPGAGSAVSSAPPPASPAPDAAPVPVSPTAHRGGGAVEVAPLPAPPGAAPAPTAEPSGPRPAPTPTPAPDTRPTPEPRPTPAAPPAAAPPAAPEPRPIPAAPPATPIRRPSPDDRGATPDAPDAAPPPAAPPVPPRPRDGKPTEPPAAKPDADPRGDAEAKPDAPATDAPGDAAPGKGDGRFLMPVKGKLISGFGPKPDGSRNDGLNIAAAKGTPVWAAGDGVVTYAGNELKGFGNLLLVRHADGWVTAYTHLDAMRVGKGDRVKRGQVIGTVGQTGSVDSPQLHFELRKSNQPIDPSGHL